MFGHFRDTFTPFHFISSQTLLVLDQFRVAEYDASTSKLFGCVLTAVWGMKSQNFSLKSVWELKRGQSTAFGFSSKFEIFYQYQSCFKMWSRCLLDIRERAFYSWDHSLTIYKHCNTKWNRTYPFRWSEWPPNANFTEFRWKSSLQSLWWPLLDLREH